MTSLWIVRHRESGEEQLVQTDGCYAPYDGEVFEMAELERELDPVVERWDWDAGAIVLRATPQQAKDQQWEKAKAYRDQRQQEPLPIADVVDGKVIIAERDERGQKWIDRFTGCAGAALASGEDFTITFTDFAKNPFTLSAQQILKLSAASVTQQALCHEACRAIAAELDAALAAPDASAEAIFAIDITAGYPVVPVPGAGGEEE